MLESISQFWYLYVVIIALIVAVIICGSKAAKAMSKRNKIVREQEEKLLRMKELSEKYKDLTPQQAKSADAKELTEGVAMALERTLEKSDNPDNQFKSVKMWQKIAFALFFFNEDVGQSLQFFFKNNAEPLPGVAVKALNEIGYSEISTLAARMYAMYDDKNEDVSLDLKLCTELNEKFKAVYDENVLYEKIKEYIIVKISE